MMEKVLNKIKRQVHHSAIQIRFGGAKGMLVRNDWLEGDVVQLRKSQIKFKSEDRELGVVKVSSFS